MNTTILIIAGITGCCSGAGFVWLFMRSRTAILNDRLCQITKDKEDVLNSLVEKSQSVNQLTTKVTTLETTLAFEQEAAEEKIQLLNKTTEELRTTFKALSSDALKSNTASFLDLAKSMFDNYQEQSKKEFEHKEKSVEGLVNPLQESLKKVSAQVEELEKSRQKAYGSLSEQVKSLVTTQEKLRSETTNLTKALRSPTVRGRWGEIQLKRVVEIAGMIPYCDFSEQQSQDAEEGKLRPDLIVKLPGNKNIIVDAKAPLKAYLDSLDSADENQKAILLKEHARHIRAHITRLSAKAYWEQFDATPEFVIMFLPGETFFSAALEQDHSIIEEGVNQRVIIASPTTLIALLRAVAYGWRQERIADNAQAISSLGKELYERLCNLTDHFISVGKHLDRSVESYNRAIGTLEKRVLTSARRFTQLGSGSKEDIQYLSTIEKSSRDILSPELREPGASTPDE